MPISVVLLSPEVSNVIQSQSNKLGILLMAQAKIFLKEQIDCLFIHVVFPTDLHILDILLHVLWQWKR